MLWLAGLMGIVGVGAASIAVVQLQEDVEEDVPETEPAPAHTGDLLDIFEPLYEHEEDPIDVAEDVGDDALWADILGEVEGPSQPVSPQDKTLLDSDFKLSWESDENAVRESDDFAQVTTFQFEDETAEDHTSLEETPPRHNALTGDWINQGSANEVMAYDKGKDSLMLVWDDMVEGAQEPVVSVEKDSDDPEVMHINMNGGSIAEIYGDPELSLPDVTVIPLSSALIAGLEPA